jgi:hypothetical protein
MARLYALVFATIGCACGSVPETAPSDAPALSIVKVPQSQQANLPDEESPRSTVPTSGDDRKDSALDAIARAMHIYWFFGSR